MEAKIERVRVRAREKFIIYWIQFNYNKSTSKCFSLSEIWWKCKWSVGNCRIWHSIWKSVRRLSCEIAHKNIHNNWMEKKAIVCFRNQRFFSSRWILPSSIHIFFVSTASSLLLIGHLLWFVFKSFRSKCMTLNTVTIRWK